MCEFFLLKEKFLIYNILIRTVSLQNSPISHHKLDTDDLHGNLEMRSKIYAVLVD